MAKLITMLRIETGQGPSIRYTEDRTMDSPLTSKGCDQVKLVGARIVRDGDKFDLAVSTSRDKTTQPSTTRNSADILSPPSQCQDKSAAICYLDNSDKTLHVFYHIYIYYILQRGVC